MRRWNDVRRVGDWKWVLDLAQDRMNGCVKTEGFLDDLVVKVKLMEITIGQGVELASLRVDTKNALLLLVKLLLDVGTVSELQEDPGRSGRGRVLAGHEQSNHHVCNLMRRDLSAILVLALHEVPDHILFTFTGLSRLALSNSRTPFLNNLGVNLGHLLVSNISLPVMREWRPWEHEVDRAKSHIEVMVEVCKGGVELLADLLSLKGAGGGIDSQLGHGGHSIKFSLLWLQSLLGRLAGKFLVGSDILLDFAADKLDVGRKGGGGEAEFNEL